MRRVMGIVVVLALVLGGIGLWRSAYDAGVSEGIRRAADAGQVVEVVGTGRGYGFFPGFFLFPLLLFGTFALVGGAFRRGRWGGSHGSHGGPWGKGPWSDEHRERFEEKAREWHSREHEGAVPPPPASTA